MLAVGRIEIGTWWTVNLLCLGGLYLLSGGIPVQFYNHFFSYGAIMEITAYSDGITEFWCFNGISVSVSGALGY